MHQRTVTLYNITKQIHCPWEEILYFSNTTVRNTMPLQLPGEPAVVLPLRMSICQNGGTEVHIFQLPEITCEFRATTLRWSSGQRLFPDPLPLLLHGTYLFPSCMRLKPRDVTLVPRETVKLASPSIFQNPTFRQYPKCKNREEDKTWKQEGKDQHQ